MARAAPGGRDAYPAIRGPTDGAPARTPSLEWHPHPQHREDPPMSPIRPSRLNSPAGPAGPTTRRGVLPLLLTAAGGLSLAACGMTGAPRGERDAGQGRRGPGGAGAGALRPHPARVPRPAARALGAGGGGTQRGSTADHHPPRRVLGPAPAQYQNVTAGAMDIGLGVHSYTPGASPSPRAWSCRSCGTRPGGRRRPCRPSTAASRRCAGSTQTPGCWPYGPTGRRR